MEVNWFCLYKRSGLGSLWFVEVLHLAEELVLAYLILFQVKMLVTESNLDCFTNSKEALKEHKLIVVS